MRVQQWPEALEGDIRREGLSRADIVREIIASFR